LSKYGDPQRSFVYIDPAQLMQLDDRVRLDLESIRSYFFDGLLWATGAVLLGVLLEGPEVIHELYRRVTIFPGSSTFSSTVYPTVHVEGGNIRKWLSFLGWFILVIGLCGEGLFEGLVTTADGRLQTFNEILLGDAQRQASEANLARAKIEERISARHITAEQRSSLIREVKPLRLARLTVDTILGDPEALEYAQELADALSPCVGTVARHRPDSFPTKPVRGVFVEFREDRSASVEHIAGKLLSALIQAGMPMQRTLGTIKVDEGTSGDEIVVRVFSKPN
jgi:hypothetical protein